MEEDEDEAVQHEFSRSRIYTSRDFKQLVFDYYRELAAPQDVEVFTTRPRDGRSGKTMLKIFF